jgi:hypothetical protein
MSNVANPTRQNEGNENTSGNIASAVSEKATEAGNFLADKANEAGKYVADSAKTMASSAMHSAENAASYMGQCADDTRCSVGSSMKSMADSLRSATPEDSMIHGAAGSVASSLESAGQYIADHGFDGMAEDMTNMIRRNPIPAICIAVGIGFLLARATTSSRS